MLSLTVYVPFERASTGLLLGDRFINEELFKMTYRKIFKDQQGCVVQLAQGIIRLHQCMQLDGKR